MWLQFAEQADKEGWRAEAIERKWRRHQRCADVHAWNIWATGRQGETIVGHAACLNREIHLLRDAGGADLIESWLPGIHRLGSRGRDATGRSMPA